MDLNSIDDELECPGCRELVSVARPLGVELRMIESPSYTSEGGSVTILVGSDVVHHCRDG